MAGSLIPVSYQRDSGQFYALNRDESNSRASISSDVSSFVPLFLPSATPFVGGLPPKGFKERYANTYLKSDPRVRRRFPIGNPAALVVATTTNAEITAPVSPDGPAVRWVVTTTRGESNPRQLNFTANDSGQDDGTPGAGVAGT